MRFEKNTIYHVYNQGNNRQLVFFCPENYLFFLRKMREYITPYADFLCYCLMPNHFHWLIYVRETVLEMNDKGLFQSEAVTPSHHLTTPEYPEPLQSEAVTPSHRLTTQAYPKTRTLNDSIAILLRSYTRAINIQEKRTGSLFRKETKAKDGWDNPYLTLLSPDYARVWQNWEIYGNTCLQYIHNNPVRAGLVLQPEDWKYSSAPDFAGIRLGTLCNQALAKELLRLP